MSLGSQRGLNEVMTLNNEIDFIVGARRKVISNECDRR
jgi:hypothetical protein